MKDQKTQTVKDIVILILIALAIGVYLIPTTVTISQDAVQYIKYAGQLPENAHQLLRSKHPMGYPAMILMTHSIFSLFCKSDFVTSWVLSGQICTLMTRLAATIFLYLFGIQFFKRRHVFTSLLILTFLPYPVEYSVDALRDWPHMLFLFAGLFLLAKGLKRSSGLYLTLAGVICGLGFTVRPECAQVVIYGAAIFFIKQILSIFRKEKFTNRSIYLGLVAGFLLIFIPYTIMRGGTLPRKIEDLLLIDRNASQVQVVTPTYAQSLQANAKLMDAGMELSEILIENLYYFFIIPAVLGLYLQIVRKKNFCDKFLTPGLFIGFNFFILILLHWNWGYISKRHALPLCVMLCFYAPAGIVAIGAYFKKIIPVKKWELKDYVRTLVIIGIASCIPKTLSPMGRNKAVYREAAEWINTHTDSGCSFYTFDPRIPFYGQRPNSVTYVEGNFQLDNKPDYVICVSKDGQLNVEMEAAYVLAASIEDKIKNKDVKIYQRAK